MQFSRLISLCIGSSVDETIKGKVTGLKRLHNYTLLITFFSFEIVYWRNLVWCNPKSLNDLGHDEGIAETKSVGLEKLKIIWLTTVFFYLNSSRILILQLVLKLDGHKMARAKILTNNGHRCLLTNTRSLRFGFGRA